jgi:hypothetical protein
MRFPSGALRPERDARVLVRPRPWRPVGRGLRMGVGRNSLEPKARATLSYMAQAWLRWPPALEHRQLPLRTSLVKAQNVQIAIAAFDFEVAIV